MKKIVISLLILSMIVFPIISQAQTIDFSTMTLSELVKLSEQITMAMWKTEEWQEVKVPAGLYQVGVEIPAGKWTITATPQTYSGTVKIGTQLEDNGLDISWLYSESNNLYGTDSWAYNESKMNSWTVTLTDGMFIKMEAAMIFTPYAGPSFTFK